uniref:Alkyl hydroperoxide reductase subunit C/ Thiol specific antioxidant domain-containing protein n=1 Tax=Amphimedon queenslandica TaxID=400682 RepID=A0A1X7V0E1_AMPQE
MDEFSEASCNVVAIATGNRENAFTWIKKHNVPVPLFIDDEKFLYNCFGLGRRCTLLGLHMIDRYATKVIKNDPIPPAYSGDDLFLMGGDFILNERREVVYQFATEENERPTIDELLSSINN